MYFVNFVICKSVKNNMTILVSFDRSKVSVFGFFVKARFFQVRFDNFSKVVKSYLAVLKD